MAKIYRTVDGLLLYKCPGCGCNHAISSRWRFNGDFEKPTVTPSILIQTGHYIPEHKGRCWCVFNAEQRKEGKLPANFECKQCHSMIIKGKIQFFDDCTHELAGKLVDMIDFVPERN